MKGGDDLSFFGISYLWHSMALHQDSELIVGHSQYRVTVLTGPSAVLLIFGKAALHEETKNRPVTSAVADGFRV